MARVQFKVRSIVVTRLARPAVSQRSLRALALVDDQDDEVPQGPGWFDSSWELIRGLEVNEGSPSDARLNDWLEACLRSTAAARPVVSAVAQRHEQPGARLVPAAPHGALGHALQFGDLGFGVAAEVAHLDQFSEFGIDGLELV